MDAQSLASAQRPARPAARLGTSIRLQALEYRRRLGVLALVLALPVAFFLATFLTSPTTPTTVDVPERAGVVQVSVPERETWPLGVGLMGVAWAVGAAAFFSVAGHVERDRRLVVSGYAPWQILLARLAILAAIAAALATVAAVLFSAAVPVGHAELVWTAGLFAGLVAAGFGLLLGALLPRPTEGMIVIIGFFGIGSSLGPDAIRYFPTYTADRLLLLGRLAEDPAALPYLVEGVLVAAALVAVALLVWRWRTLPQRGYETRIFQRSRVRLRP